MSKSTQMAHREMLLHRKNPSQCEESRHGWTCCRLHPVVTDPQLTFWRVRESLIYEHAEPSRNREIS
jgi:hypothetical protein